MQSAERTQKKPWCRKLKLVPFPSRLCSLYHSNSSKAIRLNQIRCNILTQADVLILINDWLTGFEWERERVKERRGLMAKSHLIHMCWVFCAAFLLFSTVCLCSHTHPIKSVLTTEHNNNSQHNCYVWLENHTGRMLLDVRRHKSSGMCVFG